ncbi:MAG: hypothetical protein JSS94_03475 [Bacteroidetes bacterium]|nr:hypothetical protein [Bacteroidota bacterium]
MSTKHTHDSNILLGRNMSKDTHFQAQMKRVYLALYKQPKTMLMVSVETGILRANICRYIAEWKRLNCIHEVKTGICPISKHRAGFYTTNPEMFPSIVELSKTEK